MACFYPLTGFQLGDGQVIFVERGDVRRKLSLPCGQCVGCRLERSRQWAIRCVHEAQMHENSCFVTLTYSDEHLRSMSLVYRDYQLFMKRLRRSKGPVRFYMCGEYGEQFERPHFHACLFGCFFNDREVYKDLPSGARLYTSKELERLWPFGFSSIGDVTFESAAYVARYCMKKVTGKAAEQHYEYVDIGSGEISQRVPEFTHMSLKPGIGAGWFRKFKNEVYGKWDRNSDLDRIVLNGMEMRPPKYYDRLLEKLEPFTLEYKQFLREQSFCPEEATKERLAVRENVAKARLSFKKRSIS